METKSGCRRKIWCGWNETQLLKVSKPVSHQQCLLLCFFFLFFSFLPVPSVELLLMGLDRPGNWWSIASGMGRGLHEAWLSFSISVTLLHPSGTKTCHTREQESHFPPLSLQTFAMHTPILYLSLTSLLQTLGWQPATLSPPAVFPNLAEADWSCLDKWMTSKLRARTKIAPSLFPKSPYYWWQDVAANSHQAQKLQLYRICLDVSKTKR